MTAAILTLALALSVQAAAAQAPSKPAAPKPRASFDSVAAQAGAAREAGRLDDAIALYRRGLALRPIWDEGRWYLGSSLYERDRYAEAHDAFAALIARRPTHAGAMGMQGLCEFSLGRHEAALKTLLRARSLGVKRDPEIGRVVAYHAGILLTRFEEFEIGYSVLQELVDAGVEGPTVIDAFGLNVLRMPMLPAVIPEARKPLVQLAGRAGYALASRRLADAARLFDELVEAYPHEPNVHYARGVLRTAENPDGVLADFDAEIAISPDHVPARLNAVFELLKRGDPARAQPYAEAAVRLAPQLFATHLAMGQVWFETGDVAKAATAFEQGVKLAPGSPQAHFLLARAYARLGRAADAERERAEFRRLEQLKTGQATGPGAAPPK